MNTTPPAAPPNSGGGEPGSAAAARQARAGLGIELAAELRTTRRELTEQLDVLSARLDGVAGQLGDVDAITRQTTGMLAEALPHLEDLTAAVAELRGQVTALTAQPKEPPNPPVPWPTLTAEQAESAWPVLADWVADVLGPWYQLTRAQLPDCWALHPPVVMLLSVLRTAHVEALAPRTHAATGMDWHTRWLPDTLRAIRSAIPDRWCRPGEHQVDEYSSHLARGAQGHSSVPPPAYGPPPAAQPSSAPTPGVHRSPLEEITTREHWGPFYEQAVTADVGARRAREAAAQAYPAEAEAKAAASS